MIRGVFFILSFIFYSQWTVAQITVTLDSTVIEERIIVSSTEVPWEICWGPDDFIWMTERIGKVSRINPESGEIFPLVDLQNQVANDEENGLLGLVHHPGFPEDPFVYLVYTYEYEGSLLERLSRFEYLNQQLVNETFLIDSLPTAQRHSGSRLIISEDNKIFMTLGDGEEKMDAQDSTILAGKVLRINLDGSIPADNPYDDSYVYSYGHRNGQGLVLGPTGILYASEHGSFKWDEINIIEPKRNYGWPLVQGFCDTFDEQPICAALNIKEPIYQWEFCPAVNDMVFYQNDEISEWKGKMLMATLGGNFGTPGVYVLTLSEDGLSVVNEKRYFKDYGRVRDICINPNNGAIYFATNGPFYPGFGPNSIVEYKFKLITNVDELSQDNEDLIRVKPNVVSAGGIVEVHFNFSYQSYHFDIYAQDGRIVQSKKINTETEMLSTEGWSSGIYVLRLRSKMGHSIFRKIVVQ